MVSLTQLGIANQQLNTTVIMLDHRQSPRIIVAQDNANYASSFGLERKPPPGYEESQLIAAVRQRNLRKRASARAVCNALTDMDNSESLLYSSPSMRNLRAELPGDDVRERGAKNLSDRDFDTSSITSSTLDETFGHSQHTEHNILSPPVLGRARSRRWLEAHCSSEVTSLPVPQQLP